MAFPTRLQTLLDEGRASIRSGARFEFGTGTYGLWNGKGDLTFGSLVYWANSIIQVEEAAQSMGTSAIPLTIKLPAKTGLTPDKLLLIEQEDYKNRPVIVYDFYFDPDDMRGGLLHAEPRYSGYMDTIDHRNDNGEVYLQGNVETLALDNFRDGYRSASHEDQQLVSPGDKFLEFASKVKNEYFDISLQ